MYQIGDRIAHPMHGAGIVEDILEECSGGKTQLYYVLRMAVGSMTVMIPCEHSAEIGMRVIIDEAQADEIIRQLPGLPVEDTQNWNQRFRDNMFKIKSGDLLQVASVAKSLVKREARRGLSTGERKLLNSARQILISEIMLAKSAPYDEIAHIVNQGLIG